MKRVLAASFTLTLLSLGFAGCGQRESQVETPAEKHTETTQMAAQSHDKSQLHGGMSVMTKTHHFEVVFMAEGIRVYTYDMAQDQMSASGITGEVTLEYPGQEPQVLALQYMAEVELPKETGSMPMTAHDYLFASVDLSGQEPGSFRAQFAISGLPDSTEESVEFVQPFGGVTERGFMCPMNADVWGETAESKCPLCGMKTTLPRPEISMSESST